MASQKQQYTILYGRLSQEDERAGESNSIQHQRDLLEKYARDKGFENTLFLADDGYSGTNFERPSWKKIVEMIEAGEVSTLIVKDASRWGVSTCKSVTTWRSISRKRTCGSSQ